MKMKMSAVIIGKFSAPAAALALNLIIVINIVQLPRAKVAALRFSDSDNLPIKLGRNEVQDGQASTRAATAGADASADSKGNCSPGMIYEGSISFAGYNSENFSEGLTTGSDVMGGSVVGVPEISEVIDYVYAQSHQKCQVVDKFRLTFTTPSQHGFPSVSDCMLLAVQKLKALTMESGLLGVDPKKGADHFAGVYRHESQWFYGFGNLVASDDKKSTFCSATEVHAAPLKVYCMLGSPRGLPGKLKKTGTPVSPKIIEETKEEINALWEKTVFHSKNLPKSNDCYHFNEDQSCSIHRALQYKVTTGQTETLFQDENGTWFWGDSGADYIAGEYGCVYVL